MKCDFVVGQKVVCIADDDDTGPFKVLTPCRKPEVGKIYTIREIKISDTTGQVGLKLVEIEDQRVVVSFSGVIGMASIMWTPKCFRPLVTRKTDISIFKAMLTPAGRVPVDA